MATGFTLGKETQIHGGKSADFLNGDKRSSQGIRIKRETSSGTLEIFDNGKNVNSSREKSSSSFNSNRNDYVSQRPVSSDSLGRMTPGSSKQISLQTVKRKTDSDDVTLHDLDLEMTNEDMEKTLNARLEKLNLVGRTSRNSVLGNYQQDEEKEERVGEDESSSESENEEEKPKAPNELFMEFLTCVMNKDYTTAKKLCRMILIYEPDHEEALNFQTLIDEKILLDEQPDDSDDEEERESGHELDSGGSDDDSDESSSEDSDDSSDDDDDSRPSTVDTTDSGITSASISD